MEMWFMITLAIVTILILLFYSKIYIVFNYQRDGSKDYIAVDVYIFKGLLSYSMQVPMIEMGDINNALWLKSKIKTGHSQDETHIKREQRFIKKNVKFYIMHPSRLRHLVRDVRHYTGLYCEFMDQFIHFFHCEQLHWKTICGSEDAELTAIGTGMLWTIKGLMVSRLKKHVIVTKKPMIHVKPVFGHNSFKVDFQCIFSVRFGNIINTVRLLYLNTVRLLYIIKH